MGRELTTEQAIQLIELSELVGWPIIGDPLSNLASCGKQSENYLSHIDLILANESIEPPEIIWQFGQLPIAKNLMLYLKRHKEICYVLVDERAQWKDWLHLGNYFLSIEIKNFYDKVKEAKKSILHAQPESDWLLRWQRRSKFAHQSIESVLSPTDFN